MSDPRTTDTGQKMRRATDRIGQEAQEMVRTARDEGKRAIDDVKNRAADRAEEMARAADAAASELEKGGDGAISGYGHSLASMMRQLAGGLCDRDIEDFAAELAQFARRHPAAFLAGSVAVGFGIARILKAQNGGSFVRRARSDTEFYGDYGDYDEDYTAYDERYEAGEYDSGRFDSGSTQRDRGADSYAAREGDSEISSRSFGGTDQSGLYGDRPASSTGFDTGTGTSTTASPTSAPASSGTSPSRDYRTSPDGDPFAASSEGDERSRNGGERPDDASIETPESEATRGPRKGDLP